MLKTTFFYISASYARRAQRLELKLISLINLLHIILIVIVQLQRRYCNFLYIIDSFTTTSLCIKHIYLIS